jgi:hypothetical protein
MRNSTPERKTSCVCTFLAPAAQRLALVALGRTAERRPNEKRLRLRKLPENAPNPQRPLHALLGAF